VVAFHWCVFVKSAFGGLFVCKGFMRSGEGDDDVRYGLDWRGRYVRVKTIVLLVWHFGL